MDATWNTKGLDTILKRLEMAENLEVRWGFLDAKYGDDNEYHYVAQVAKWQEEGTKGGHIPPRPFFKTNIARILAPADPKGYRVHSVMKSVISGVMLNKYRQNFLEPVGKVLQEALQEEILDFNNPRNSDTTIKRKGFDDPLIETGVMYDSVSYKIVRKKEK